MSSQISQASSKEKESRKGDFQFVAHIISFCVLGLAIYQYSRQTEQNLEVEFKRALWLQKKEVFTNLCSVLGSMAAVAGSEYEFKTELKKFYALYYGSVKLIDDKIVNKQIDEIRITLETAFDAHKKEEVNLLKEKTLRLDSLCRVSLEEDIKKLE